MSNFLTCRTFTFHNVSIKTYGVAKKKGIYFQFTFHNVSIKTLRTQSHMSS